MAWSPQTTHLIELLTMPKTRNDSILILSTDSRDINVNSINCLLSLLFSIFRHSMHMDDDDIILEQVPDIDMFNLDDDLLDQLSPGAKEVCL